MTTMSYIKQIIRAMCMLFLILLAHISPAQVVIHFVPALNAQTINGLFTAQVQNSSALTYNGRIRIAVKDAGDKLVAAAVTPAFLLKPGAYLIQALAGQSRWQFGSSSTGRVLAETGRFVENDYEYCFEFTGSEDKPGADEHVYENCYNYSLQPVFPMSLVYPDDGDRLCQTRPSFTWQAPLGVAGNYLYRLTVVEKKDKQVVQDALLNNVPVFQQENINGCVAYYPPQLPELQKPKTYAWQVVAYQGNNRITQSEIWTFTINCDTRKVDSSKDSYRQLSAQLDGNYYTSNGILRFSIINPYNPTMMQYTVTDLSDPTKKIGNTPSIKLQTGLNRIDLPLEDVSGIAADKMYLLKVTNIGDHTQYLQFINKGK